MKRKSLLALVVLSLILPLRVLANDIDSINFQVQIMDNGDMRVKQVWDAYTDEGTEFYMPMQNLNHMDLKDLQVSMNGKAFTTLDEWDVDRSFEDKAYTAGINTGPGFPEICFGITEYGSNEFEISYTLTNGVQAFPDYDGFNVRFINDEMQPIPETIQGEVFIEGKDLSEENARVWAFGYDGEVNFEDGKVRVRTNDFNFFNHITLVLGFDKGIINPSYQGEGTFEELRDRALENSDYGNPDDYQDYVPGEDYGPGSYEEYRPPMGVFAGFIPFVIPLLAGAGALISSKAIRNRNKPRNLKHYMADKGQYHRDPPVDGNLAGIGTMESYTNEYKFENLMTAYLLKWLKEGAIAIHDSEEGLIFKRQSIVVEFLKKPDFSFASEEDLYAYLYKASGDGVLEEKELKNYVSRHTSSYSNLSTGLISEGKTYLAQAKYLARDNRNKLVLTEEGGEEYRKLGAYKNFLKDFTLINEREPIEVKLWDQILIVAAALGMADTVSKQFEKIYPDYVFSQRAYGPGMNYSTFYYINRLSGLSATASSSYNSTVQASRSSGFGGGSSFGGGGGFSGGGSGGGTR